MLIATVIDRDLLCDFTGISRENIYYVNWDGIAESLSAVSAEDLVESIVDQVFLSGTGGVKTSWWKRFEIRDSEYGTSGAGDPGGAY